MAKLALAVALAGMAGCASFSTGTGGSDDDGDGDGAVADAGPAERPPTEAEPGPGDLVIRVATADELLAALETAGRGSVVYVADDAELDLTGRVAIAVPAQVTIASSGSPGALIYTDELDTLPLFRTSGEGVRFTGLRLRGPDPDIGATPYGTPLARAIDAYHADNLQVDHAELSGWSHAAIMLDYAHRAWIHHDSIHHNRRTGLGYGVLLNHDATALIERNSFDYNRHAIAGTGRRELRYHARYNLVGPNRNGHAFDMHGEDEALDNGAPWAGDLIRIHHNSFLGVEQGIVIRGRPMTGAYIDHNCFGQSSSAGTAIIQRYFFGNLFASDNAYSQSSPACHQGAAPASSVRGDVNGDGLADLVTLAHGNGYVYLGSASGLLTAVPPAFGGTMDSGLFDGEGHVAIDVADVDGDGFADLVTAHSDGNVYVYRGALAGTFHHAVASFAGTYVGFEPIAVADVDGDGLADLVSQKGGEALVHRGRADGSFIGSAVASFRGTYDSGAADGAGHIAVDVADVNGDGRADLVTINGATGYVYPGQASGAFGSAVSSFAGTYRLALVAGDGFEPVAVADVNGDGRADLVSAHTDGNAYVHFGTSGATFSGRADSFHNTLPTTLFGARTGYEVIAALDMTGDGRADLVAAHTGGEVIVFPADAGGHFTTGARSFHGSYPVGRFDPAGHEALNEKSLLRRRGCAPAGCF
jgi:hypothetical protein